MSRTPIRDSVKTILLGVAILAGLTLDPGTSDARDIRVAAPAGGCVWGPESDFRRAEAAIDVVSGAAAAQPLNG